MLIIPTTLPRDMREVWDEVCEAPNNRQFRGLLMTPLQTGEYYLCTDSGLLEYEEPDCKHELVVVENYGWYVDFPDPILSDMLRRTHRESLPEGVVCIPGHLVRW